MGKRLTANDAFDDEGHGTQRTVVLRGRDAIVWQITIDSSHPALQSNNAPFN